MESFTKKAEINQAPFKSGLIESDVSTPHIGIEKIYELKNNPEKIVRAIKYDELKKECGYLMDPVSLAALGRKLYKELETGYGINVSTEYVLGKSDKGSYVIYGVNDRVQAEEMDGITPELARQTEKLYTSVSKYYFDKSKKLSEGEYYLTDIASISQYAYGTKKDDRKVKLYLIDTDLYMKDDKISFYYVVAWLARHIGDVEKEIGKSFDVARLDIQNMLKDPNVVGLDERGKEAVSRAVNEAKKFLEGEFSEESDDLPTGIFSME